MSVYPSPLGSLLVLLVLAGQFTPEPTDYASISTIRTFAADAVGKANSGHPCAPMGIAPASHVLFTPQVMSSNHGISNSTTRTLQIPSGSTATDRFHPMACACFLAGVLFTDAATNVYSGHALQYTLMHLLEYKHSIDGLVTPKAPSYFRNIG
ncbi:hypothetical protein CY34DRAFT_19908 [Suillus luteus UH-Slu-Lm8-n1]|uniref:Transketolase N-terminal domain-containing protein n=1 Tax=Suillus luteus UH-Slu-Lm8-n1 TaxID=930992 RepID=A0A0C9ZQ95_9AGAM|nr:hypothetical protein CY34DRAFT_19908 [Suillus luteus UH-Slu-Lm8-n1]